MSFPAPRPAQNKPLLVVDDDADLRELLRELLELQGYTVTTAVNGQDALTHLRDSPPPAVILLDLMMPIMDGSQFLEEQRKDPDLARIPVVTMTAGRNLEHLAAGHPLLAKPFDLDKLLELLERSCRR